MGKVWDVVGSVMELWRRVIVYSVSPALGRVDRDRYIRMVYGGVCGGDVSAVGRMLDSSPALVIGGAAARECVGRQVVAMAVATTVATFVLSMAQSGVVSYVCLVIDFLQFQLAVMVSTKMIAYTYYQRAEFESSSSTGGSSVIKDGEVNLFAVEDKRSVSETAKRFATSAVGFAVKNVIRYMSKRVVIRLFVFNIAKQVAKMSGQTLTVTSFEEQMPVMVAVVTAGVSAVVTWVLYYPMMRHHAAECHQSFEDTISYQS